MLASSEVFCLEKSIWWVLISIDSAATRDCALLLDDIPCHCQVTIDQEYCTHVGVIAMLDGVVGLELLYISVDFLVVILKFAFQFFLIDSMLENTVQHILFCTAVHSRIISLSCNWNILQNQLSFGHAHDHHPLWVERIHRCCLGCPVLVQCTAVSQHRTQSQYRIWDTSQMGLNPCGNTDITDSNRDWWKTTHS